MTSGIKTVIYPVRDVGRAKEVYGKLLGVEPSMDEPYYVGFAVSQLDVGLDPRGHSQGLTGPVSYWHCDDIEERVRLLIEAGAKELQPIKDVGGGKLIASVTDADSNPIGLLQPPK